MKRAIRMHPEDHVATLLDDVAAGEEFIVELPDGSRQAARAAEPIPFGHKIAVTAIDADQILHKYGTCIGRAITAVALGHHIHVHNLRSLTVGRKS